MRVAFVLLLAVAASALSHTDSINHELAKVATRTTFGQNVLQELQTKINAGSPVDELKAILTEIVDRLKEAQTADDAQHAQHQADCESDINDLDNQIADLETVIAGLESDIETSKDRIKYLGDQIVTQEGVIVADKANIARIEDEIAALIAQRDLDHRTFLNRTRDTNECIAAIGEIKQVEGLDNLKARENETADDYNEAYYDKTPAAPSLLEKLAQRTTDETARNLVLLASVAAVGLSKGDVADLVALLNKLESELKAYLVELQEDEDESVRIFLETKANLEDELRLANEKLADDEAHLADLNNQLDAEKKHQQDLQNELADNQQRLADTRDIRAAYTKKCADLATAHENRTEDRNEEFATLEQIMNIIKEKLGGAADHVLDAVDDVTVKDQ